MGVTTEKISLCLLVAFLGCATTPPVVSLDQRRAFLDVVRKAEAAGAAVEPPDAVVLLRDAKADFDYAQRVPRNPDHARHLLLKAQAEAELALSRALGETDRKTIAHARATATARSELTTSAVIP
jgi:Domain of unknown function (DUF4398)